MTYIALYQKIGKPILVLSKYASNKNISRVYLIMSKHRDYLIL
jgi:hypothetical protein